jgi:hypothetical protein
MEVGYGGRDSVQMVCVLDDVKNRLFSSPPQFFIVGPILLWTVDRPETHLLVF